MTQDTDRSAISVLDERLVCEFRPSTTSTCSFSRLKLCNCCSADLNRVLRQRILRAMDKPRREWAKQVIDERQPDDKRRLPATPFSIFRHMYAKWRKSTRLDHGADHLKTERDLRLLSAYNRISISLVLYRPFACTRRTHIHADGSRDVYLTFCP